MCDECQRGAVQPGPQYLVPVDHVAQQRLQLLTRDAVGQPERLGLRQPTRLTVLVEPAAVGQQRDRTRVLLDIAVPNLVVVDCRGEFAHRRTVQHEPGPQDQTATSHRLHHRERDDAVQAEVEEVGGDVHVACVEHVGQHLGDDLLGLGRGRLEPIGLPLGVDGRQRRIVDLAVGGQRDLADRENMVWHQVSRQRRSQHAAQVVHRGLRHHVRRQPRSAAMPAHGHVRVPDPGMAVQRGGDFTRFHAEAADLDLIVGAAEKLDRAVGKTPDHVARAVHPGARCERIGDEPARRLPRPAQVAARELPTGQVQLAGDTVGNRAQPAVEHVRHGRVGGFADARLGMVGDRRDDCLDSRLGRAVTVVRRHPGAFALGLDRLPGRGVDGFATEGQHRQRHRGKQPGRTQLGEHRGRGVDHVDREAPDGLDHGLSVALHVVADDVHGVSVEQRHERLPRRVERERPRVREP